jgi:hypothetical protein
MCDRLVARRVVLGAHQAPGEIVVGGESQVRLLMTANKECEDLTPTRPTPTRPDPDPTPTRPDALP